MQELYQQCQKCGKANAMNFMFCYECGARLNGVASESNKQLVKKSSIENNIHKTGWYYEDAGTRRGGISESAMISLIKSGKVGYGSIIWREGYQNWTPIENTELRTHLGVMAPPPLMGEHVNNTIVWILAFAPLIGQFMENVIAGAIHGDTLLASVAVQSGQYWYVTLILNICLSFFDETKLSKAGHDTKKFKGWLWLVPVYLYQRSKKLNQNLSYLIVWIVCFAFIILLGSYGSNEVHMVKNGRLDSCPNATVGQMVDSFMGSPSWESGESGDGKTFVNVAGEITYAGKPVNAQIQFVIDKEHGTFQFQAMEFNKVPQVNLMALGLLDRMCESAKK